MNSKPAVSVIIRWLFGLLVLLIGILNTFEGTTCFGVFIFIVSFIYFLPLNAVPIKLTGYSIPHAGMLKIIPELLSYGHHLKLENYPVKSSK